MELSVQIENLFRRDRSKLVGFIRERVRSKEEAEDILQDVFANVLAAASEVTEPIENLGAWVFTAIRNRIIDSYRKKRPQTFTDTIYSDDEGDVASFENFLSDITLSPERSLVSRTIREAVLEALGGMEAARGKRVALLGLTFKPNTDDMRDSPAIAVAQALTDAGVKVRAYDPEGMEQARPLMRDVEFASGPYEVAEQADAVVLVTEWDVFRALDLKRLVSRMAQPIFVDLRNVYPSEDLLEAGFSWHAIGRGSSPQPPAMRDPRGETVAQAARSAVRQRNER